MGELFSPADLAVLDPGVSRWMAETFHRAAAQGVVGVRDDGLAAVSDWGFDLAAITVPVAIWQGDADAMVPYAHGAWLAEHVPDARAHLLPGAGHLLAITHLERGVGRAGRAGRARGRLRPSALIGPWVLAGPRPLDRPPRTPRTRLLIVSIPSARRARTTVEGPAPVQASTTQDRTEPTMNTSRKSLGATAVIAMMIAGLLLVASPVARAASPSDKDECKKGGWRSLTDDAGEPFRNQGQCVSWVQRRGETQTTNTAPVAIDSPESCPPENPLCQNQFDGNLNDFATDADGDPLTFVIVSYGDVGLSGTPDQATAEADFFRSPPVLDPLTGEWSALCGAHHGDRFQRLHVEGQRRPGRQQHRGAAGVLLDLSPHRAQTVPRVDLDLRRRTPPARRRGPRWPDRARACRQRCARGCRSRPAGGCG